MSAKYPPKVKLELLTTLECQSWGWIMRTLVSKGFGAFIVVEGWHLFLGLEVFSL